MGFRFHDLDETTRSLMLEEVDRDSEQGTLYLSSRLTDRGRRDWPGLLRDAVRVGDESNLAESLMGTGRMKETEQRRSASRRGWGRVTEARVPSTAPLTLAEGEFNRFYIRGVCRRAIDAGLSEVQVYRAKEVDNPRSESSYLIGSYQEAASLLEDLRAHSGEETSFLVPGGPNSGLSVRLSKKSQP